MRTDSTPSLAAVPGSAAHPGVAGSVAESPSWTGIFFWGGGRRDSTSVVGWVVAALLLVAGILAGPAAAQRTMSFQAETLGPTPEKTYSVYVGAESADLIHVIEWGPDGVRVAKSIPVGEMATETESPHGFNMSRDGEYLYWTTGHGVPDGKLWKYHAGPDTLVGGPTDLGFFPATLDLTPDGLYAFVANFNLHGEMIPSTVSVVFTPDMVEVDQIETCVMPHGLRVAPDGNHLYTNCMMNDLLVEVDTRTFRVSRYFSVAPGAEGPWEKPETAMDHGGDHAAMHAMHHPEGGEGHEMEEMETGEGMAGGDGGAGAGEGMAGMDHSQMGPFPMSNVCSPTWAEPSADGTTIYVACNKADQILEIDRESWSVARSFEAGRAPYNLDITPDGRLLVATLKGGAGVQFFDLASGEAVATTPSTTTVTHGVVVSPDSRYAFVSVEGVGAEAGKVDVYDLESFELVGTAETGQQAGGITFWRVEG